MGKFEIKKDKAGEFRFNLKARNGQVILSSEGYKAKPSCMNGIEYVRKEDKYNENIIGLLGISLNISERKRLEAELQKAKEAAETASSAKTEFILNYLMK